MYILICIYVSLSLSLSMYIYIYIYLYDTMIRYDPTRSDATQRRGQPAREKAEPASHGQVV